MLYSCEGVSHQHIRNIPKLETMSQPHLYSLNTKTSPPASPQLLSNDNNDNNNDNTPYFTDIWCGDRFSVLYQRETNRLFCKGRNEYYQCGVNSKKAVIREPQELAFPQQQQLSAQKLLPNTGTKRKPLSFVACGPHHAFACFEGDEVYAWGRNQYALGLPNVSTNLKVPTKVPLPSQALRVLKISCGDAHTFFLCEKKNHTPKDEADGKEPSLVLYSCGSNYWNQCGISDEDCVKGLHEVTLPPLISDDDTVAEIPVDVFAFGQSSIILSKSGNLYFCGHNTLNMKPESYSEFMRMDRMELPAEEMERREMQPANPLCAQITHVSMGAAHLFIVFDYTRVYCMGDNRFLQLGMQPESDSENFISEWTRVDYNAGKPVKRISSSMTHTSILTIDNEIIFFGDSKPVQKLQWNSRIETLSDVNHGQLYFVAESSTSQVRLHVDTVKYISDMENLTAMTEADSGEYCIVCSDGKLPIFYELVRRRSPFLVENKLNGRSIHAPSNLSSLKVLQQVVNRIYTTHNSSLDKSGEEVSTHSLQEEMQDIFNSLQKESQISDPGAVVRLLLNEDGSKAVSAHRCVLTHRSNYFRKTLSHQPSDLSVIPLYQLFVQDDESLIEALGEFLQYLYTGTLKITMDNVISLLHLMELFMEDQVSITDKCTDLIFSALNDENLLSVYLAIWNIQKARPIQIECERRMRKDWNRYESELKGHDVPEEMLKEVKRRVAPPPAPV